MGQGNSNDNSNPTTLDRRNLFKFGAAAATILGSASLPSLTRASNASAAAGGAAVANGLTRKRALRVAHLTDIHLGTDRNAPANFATVLAQVQELKPDLILNGGDSILDSYGRDAASTKTQWETFQSVLKKDCSVPMEAILGNHDIWGWDKQRSGATGNEPLYGKNWALDVWKLEKPYRSFDRNGWHFVLLDSCQNAGGHYTPRLDPEQFDWLKQDLANTPKTTPVLVMSHMPIFSVCPLVMGYVDANVNWAFWSGLMHTDSPQLRALFRQHPNVKLALSGHTHLSDKVEYEGVTYCCDGAVCGAWWRGAYRDCTPGFALFDLYADGTFDRTYVPAAWAKGKELAHIGGRG